MGFFFIYFIYLCLIRNFTKRNMLQKLQPHVFWMFLKYKMNYVNQICVCAIIGKIHTKWIKWINLGQLKKWKLVEVCEPDSFSTSGWLYVKFMFAASLWHLSLFQLHMKMRCEKILMKREYTWRVFILVKLHKMLPQIVCFGQNWQPL